MSASLRKRQRPSIIRSDVKDESPGGISPPGAPKTVREPLDSHGSRCSTVGKRAAGFTSSTGSSCCQLASVGRWSRLNNAAPSVQLHYRAFVPTTSNSAPVLRIGTLVLAVLAACDFPLYIGAQVLTFRTKAWLSFAPPPCRMPLGPSQASPKLIPKGWPPPGFGIAYPETHPPEIRSGGCSILHVEAKVLYATGELGNRPGRISLDEIVGAEILIEGAVFQHVVDGREN